MDSPAGDVRRKILFIIDDFYPVASAGAVRILSFINALQDQDVHLFAGAMNDTGAATFPFRSTFVKRPRETQPLRFAMFLFRFLLKIVALLRRSWYDQIVLSVPKYELLLLAPFLKRRTQRLILDLRDSHAFLNYEAYTAHFLPRKVAAHIGRVFHAMSYSVLKRALAVADFVTAANPAILDSSAAKHPATEVVRNGVDTNMFRPIEKSFRATLNLIYMGNFAEKDEFDYLLQTLPKWRDKILFHLIGDGCNKEEVVKQLTSRDINILDHASRNHADLPQLLQQMHAGCIFRDQKAVESIPVSIFEFCSMNIPTITNDVGLMAQTVKQFGIGIVVDSVDELNAVFEELTGNPDSLKKFSNLHEVAVRNFSREIQAKKFRSYLLAQS